MAVPRQVITVATMNAPKGPSVPPEQLDELHGRVGDHHVLGGDALKAQTLAHNGRTQTGDARSSVHLRAPERRSVGGGQRIG